MYGEPGAVQIPTSSYGGLGSNLPKRYVVIHKTGGGSSGLGIARDFQRAAKSTHYVIERDKKRDGTATLYQCVSEDQYAWGNGIFEPGHAAFLPGNINPNRYTISIEHLDSDKLNRTPLTDAQKATSFALVLHICQRHNIRMAPGNAQSGLLKHSDIEPGDRHYCPNVYPWAELYAYLAKYGGKAAPAPAASVPVPKGWKIVGDALVAPNGVHVIKGMKEMVLSRVKTWDPANIPLENEVGLPQVERHNLTLGAGTRQIYRDGMYFWTPKTGVQASYTGMELYSALQELETLQSQNRAGNQAGPSAQYYKDLLSRIETLAKV